MNCPTCGKEYVRAERSLEGRRWCGKGHTWTPNDTVFNDSENTKLGNKYTPDPYNGKVDTKKYH